MVLEAAVRADVGVRERPAITPETVLFVETPDVSRLMSGELLMLAEHIHTHKAI